MLQSPHQLPCPSLDTLQDLGVFPVVRGPKVNSEHRIWSAASPVPSTRRRSLCCSCWQHYFRYKPGYHWPLPPESTAGSCSTSYCPLSLGPFLPGYMVLQLTYTEDQAHKSNSSEPESLQYMQIVLAILLGYQMPNTTSYMQFYLFLNWAVLTRSAFL